MKDINSAKIAVERLLVSGSNCVVITLGAGGVVFSGWGSEGVGSINHIPAETVNAIDTTVSILL